MDGGDEDDDARTASDDDDDARGERGTDDDGAERGDDERGDAGGEQESGRGDRRGVPGGVVRVRRGASARWRARIRRANTSRGTCWSRA